MSTPFTSIIGKPFAKNVQKELRERKGLEQTFNDQTLSNLPYFTLRRKSQLSSMESWQKDENLSERKYWTMGLIREDDPSYPHNAGADYLIENTDGYPTHGIESVDISVQDYTFHTVTVNFRVNNIHDFDKFKETWLMWGLPVEYEFGRKDGKEYVGDITPNKEIREGIIANFDYQTDQVNRTITGTITIYSATWLNVMEARANQEDDSKRLEEITASILREKYELFNDKIPSVAGDRDIYEYRTRRRWKKIRASGQVGYKRVRTKVYELVDNVPVYTPDAEWSGGDPLNIKSEYFYGILQESDWEAMVKRELDALKRRDRRDRAKSDLENQRPDDIRSIEAAIAYNIRMDQAYEEIPHALYIFGMDVFSEKKLNKLFAPDNISNFTSNEEGQSRFIDAIEDIQKFTLSRLTSGDDIREEIGSPYHYYISMQTIQEIIDFYLEEKYEVEESEVITKIDVSSSEIRNFRKMGLGLGSSFPERVVFNPWNKTYKSVVVNGDDEEVEEEVNQDGDICLLKDVFISADIVYGYSKQSNNYFEFVENIIREINNASNNILNLQKTEQAFAEESAIYAPFIMYTDMNSLEIPTEDVEFSIFNLYDPVEKIQNMTVATDIDSDMAMMTYFHNRDRANASQYLLYKGKFYDRVGNELDADSVLEDPSSLDPLNVEFGQPREYIEEDKNIIKRARRRTSDIRERVTNRLENARRDLRGFVVRNTFGGVNDAPTQLTALFLAISRIFYALQVEAYQFRKYKESTDDTAVIQLKKDLTLDGISGIMAGQVFRVGFRNFPMQYGNIETNPTFIISNLSHSFTGNSWTTILGAMLMITSKEMRSQYKNDERVRQIVEANTFQMKFLLDAIKDVLKNTSEDISNYQFPYIERD